MTQSVCFLSAPWVLSDYYLNALEVRNECSLSQKGED